MQGHSAFGHHRPDQDRATPAPARRSRIREIKGQPHPPERRDDPARGKDGKAISVVNLQKATPSWAASSKAAGISGWQSKRPSARSDHEGRHHRRYRKDGAGCLPRSLSGQGMKYWFRAGRPASRAPIWQSNAISSSSRSRSATRYRLSKRFHRSLQKTRSSVILLRSKQDRWLPCSNRMPL